MEFSELIEEIFKEAYVLGKQDGLEGVHINPSVIYDKFIYEFDFGQSSLELKVNS